MSATTRGRSLATVAKSKADQLDGIGIQRFEYMHIESVSRAHKTARSRSARRSANPADPALATHHATLRVSTAYSGTIARGGTRPVWWRRMTTSSAITRKETSCIDAFAVVGSPAAPAGLDERACQHACFHRQVVDFLELHIVQARTIT